MKSSVFVHIAIGSAVIAGLTPSADAQIFSVPNFVDEVLFTGDGATALDFGPTGVLYVTEKQGRVLYATPDGQGGYNAPQVLLDLRSSVFTSQESGLLGIAVDPDFTINRHLFIFYTTFADQRLVRYTLNAAGTSASNETVILSGLPRDWEVHKGGDINFRPGEPTVIYISLGDDTEPTDAPLLTSLRGKMLRVDKVTGLGLSTNPYYNGGALTAARARIWAIGMRNPFRFTFHPTANTPQADVLYVSENGDATDKMAWVRAGSDGGWSTAGDGPFINPSDPDHRVLFSGPASHIGIAIAATGPFSDGGQPAIYLSNWINPSGGSIRRWRLTGAALDGVSAIAADGGNPFVRQRFATHLQFGPDGSLYFTNSNTGTSQGGFYEVGRIRFVGGAPPVAAFTSAPDPIEGAVPLVVNFTDQSTDSDGTINSRAWTFGDGGTSTQTNPSHTYTTPGVYTVRLTVTDDDGLTATTEALATARRPVSLSLRGEVLDGRFLDDRRRTATTQLRFYQNDGTPIAFADGLGPQENGANVIGGDINIDLDVPLTSPFVMVTAGEADPDLATQTIAFAVPNTGAAHTETVRFAPSTTALRGRVLDTRNEPASVDLGIARDDIATLYPIAAGRDYLPNAPAGTTGVAHRVVSDALGYYYFPLREGGEYFVDVVSDTGADIYLSTLGTEAVATDTAVDLDLTVGLKAGGADCDDLTAIAPVPQVDYETQIQPLWGACIGCHKPNSPNGGGLDLTAGNSLAALVDVASTQVPGRALVEPFDPTASYLLEKVSCNNPQVGSRMRQGDPLTPEEQGLLRDWVAQGALPTPSPTPLDGGFATPDAGEGSDAGTVPDAGFASEDTGTMPDDPDDGSISGSACRCIHAPNADADGPLAVAGAVALALLLYRRRRR